MFWVISVLLLLWPTDIFSSDFIVDKIRGIVTYQNHSSLQEGARITAPGILTTLEKSLVVLHSQEGTITLGPSSKIYLGKKNNNQPTYLQLLKGIVRGQIKGKDNNNYKLYLKTRSASLGVRGTDFVVVYNDQNHITSNLTLNGKVAFFKIKDKHILESLKEDFDKTSESRDEEADINLIEDELADYKTVIIEQGKFSGAYPTYDLPLSPTLISPKQAQILSADNSLGTTTTKNSSTIVNLTKKNFQLTNKNLIPEPTESINEERLLNGPSVTLAKDSIRQGGILDINTGIYVMPPQGATFNETNNTYELPQQYGGIDSQTGQYRPPENIKLDPLKGFVKIENNQEIPIDSFSKSVNKLFDKYKNLTRVDISTDARYFYSLKTYENYYGEIKNIANAESMIFNFSGKLGRFVYSNQRYLHYLKAGMEMIYHNRQREPSIQRNDRVLMTYGYEMHRKHNFLNRNASFIFDLEFETIYQDYKSEERWDYYTESINGSFFERFKTSRFHQTDLGVRLSAYQGYASPNHGNIHEVFFKNHFTPNIPWEIDLNYSFKNRTIKQFNNEFAISKIDFSLTRLSLIRKTNISYLGSFFWSDSQKKDEFDKGFTYLHKIELTRKKGEYLRLNCFYSYMRNIADGVGAHRNFIQQMWGGGLSFIF